jgi:hypothetical protein
MRSLSFILITCLAAACSRGQSISSTARNFIATLSNDQKKETLFPFDSEERYSFHYFPINDRKGLPLDKMSEPQKKAAMSLLSACVADNTVKKINDIIELENILKVLENRKADDHFRDPGKYHIAIFGEPGDNSIWGWRFEGHHVSFHFSTRDNSLVAATPGFLGANPAIVPDGPQKGKEILKDEKQLAFRLLKSLSAEQINKTVFSDRAPDDIVTRIDRKAMINEATGVLYKDMTEAQQKTFIELIQLYVHRYKKDFADQMMKEIRDAGLQNLRFAWAGDKNVEIGHAHYYRIVGPTVIIEYDNTQNNANHVHTVVRDLKRDYGGDQLLEHYKTGHHAKQ